MKTPTTHTIVFTLLTLVCLGATSGCALNRPYPEKISYMPDLSFEKSKEPHPLPYRIKVRNSGVSAPFEGKSFVYRLPDDQWEKDFYNEWFAYPRDMITESCISALIQTGNFISITSEDSLMEADYYLEGRLLESYLDRRNSNHLQSVLKIRWMLIDYQSPRKGNSSEENWARTYEEITSLQSNQVEDYVASTGTGLKKILHQLVMDLNQQISSKLQQ